MYRDFTYIDDIIQGIYGCVYIINQDKDFNYSNPKSSKSFVSSCLIQK